MPAPTPQPAPALPLPTCFRATFDGSLGKLAYFLNWIWSHLNRYRGQYQPDQEMISVITDNMEGEAAEWVAQLHDEGAPELEDNNEFLQLLRTWFEDIAQRQEAEAEIRDLKKKGHPTKELVWKFQRVAGKLRDWPEHLLAHHFKEALD